MTEPDFAGARKSSVLAVCAEMVAAMPPTVTAVTVFNAPPLTRTRVDAGPALGDMPVTLTPGVTVNVPTTYWNPLRLDCSVTEPVDAPAGMVNTSWLLLWLTIFATVPAP